MFLEFIFFVLLEDGFPSNRTNTHRVYHCIVLHVGGCALQKPKTKDRPVSR